METEARTLRRPKLDTKDIKRVWAVFSPEYEVDGEIRQDRVLVEAPFVKEAKVEGVRVMRETLPDGYHNKHKDPERHAFAGIRARFLAKGTLEAYLEAQEVGEKAVVGAAD